MNTPAKTVNPLDHAIYHTLLRRVARQQPGAEVRQHLLERAAAQQERVIWRLGAWRDFSRRSELDWRQFALMFAMRPMGPLGVLSQQLR